ncbi:MAG: prephenate dehydrogenase [Synergistetes bacterium]|nr:prephenate dehydrogenase [Synergistota bacterium]
MKVSIVGVGLMGGSLGMALRRRIGAFVKGVVRKEETGVKALELGALDEWTLSLEEGVINADYVFFATPVKSIGSLFKEVQSYVRRGALISDLGSTKRSVVKEITSILREDLAFIGGHPMTGSEKRGVEYGREDLYEGAPYILTPVSPFDRGRVEELIYMVKSIGAKPYILDPETHDLVVALISHVPYLISVALVELVSTEDVARKLVAGNFRDLTRPALSDPIMWRDIVSDNRDFIEKRLKDLFDLIVEILNMSELEKENFFEKIKKERQNLYQVT